MLLPADRFLFKYSWTRIKNCQFLTLTLCIWSFSIILLRISFSFFSEKTWKDVSRNNSLALRNKWYNMAADLNILFITNSCVAAKFLQQCYYLFRNYLRNIVQCIGKSSWHFLLLCSFLDAGKGCWYMESLNDKKNTYISTFYQLQVIANLQRLRLWRKRECLR